MDNDYKKMSTQEMYAEILGILDKHRNRVFIQTVLARVRDIEHLLTIL